MRLLPIFCAALMVLASCSAGDIRDSNIGGVKGSPKAATDMEYALTVQEQFWFRQGGGYEASPDMTVREVIAKGKEILPEPVPPPPNARYQGKPLADIRFGDISDNELEYRLSSEITSREYMAFFTMVDGLRQSDSAGLAGTPIGTLLERAKANAQKERERIEEEAAAKK